MADEAQGEFAPMRGRAMFDQIDALPGAEHHSVPANPQDTVNDPAVVDTRGIPRALLGRSGINWKRPESHRKRTSPAGAETSQINPGRTFGRCALMKRTKSTFVTG